MNYRQVQRLELEKTLKKVGYDTFQCHLPRVRLLSLYIIAVNRLAAGTNGDVREIHKQIITASDSACRGTKFTPQREQQKWTEAQKEGEGMGDADQSQYPTQN